MGSRPVQGPNASGFALQWNIGFIHKHIQSLELRVHPAPGMHTLAMGAHLLVAVHPVSAPHIRVFLHIIYRSEKLLGARVPLHKINAQNEWLISNTDMIYTVVNLFTPLLHLSAKELYELLTTF